jgi:integrase
VPQLVALFRGGAIFGALSVYGPGAAGQGNDPALTPAQAELRRKFLDAIVSPHTRRNYGKALDDLFILSVGRPLSRELLMEYRAARDALSPSTINVRLSAVRKMVFEVRKNGLIGAEEAVNLTEVPNIPQKGTRLGNWLTREQARELLTVPDRSTLKGKRDYLILAILVGWALRREELAGLDDRDRAVRGARPPAYLRETRPKEWRKYRTNQVPARPLLNPDDGTLPRLRAGDRNRGER